MVLWLGQLPRTPLLSPLPLPEDLIKGELGTLHRILKAPPESFALGDLLSMGELASGSALKALLPAAWAAPLPPYPAAGTCGYVSCMESVCAAGSSWQASWARWDVSS